MITSPRIRKYCFANCKWLLLWYGFRPFVDAEIICFRVTKISWDIKSNPALQNPIVRVLYDVYGVIIATIATIVILHWEIHTSHIVIIQD